jgi:hypothetical protein
MIGFGSTVGIITKEFVNIDGVYGFITFYRDSLTREEL